MTQAPTIPFQDSVLWQKAHQFTLAVYNYSDYFPQKETSGLTAEFRRAAISLAVNIAAAVGKSENGTQALNAAWKEAEKCRYYLILAKDLGYGDHPELAPQLEEISRMLKEYGAEG